MRLLPSGALIATMGGGQLTRLYADFGAAASRILAAAAAGAGNRQRRQAGPLTPARDPYKPTGFPAPEKACVLFATARVFFGRVG
jgi:hypothetical protein